MQAVNRYKEPAATVQCTVLLFLRFAVFHLLLLPFASQSSHVMPCPCPPSSVIIILHNSQNSSLNADPYRVFHNLLLFVWYWRLVQTPVGGSNIPCNILYENNEMEECLYYTICYTCAYIGANSRKSEILCIFSFYVFYDTFQRLVLSSCIRLPPDI